MPKRSKRATAAAFTLATAATFSACGGGDDDQPPKSQASVEVHAELTQSGIAAITQMQDGQLIIASVQVATVRPTAQAVPA